MWEVVQQIGVPGGIAIILFYILVKEVLPVVIGSKAQNNPQQNNIINVETRKNIDSMKRKVDGMNMLLNTYKEKFDKMEKKMDDLHEAHLGVPARDDTGGYKWWFKEKTLQALEKGLEEVGDAIQEETKVLKHLADKIKALTIIAP
jgi:uncharacterized coiled-coil DUF342 family protein